MTPPKLAPDLKPEAAHVLKEFKHTRPLVSCAFDPKGRYVFAGAEDSTVQRFELETGKATALTAHESWPYALAGLPDGSAFLTGGCEGKLIWWPTADDQPSPIRVVSAHDGWIRSLAASPDGKLVASCGNDRLVKLWSAAEGTLVHTLPGHDKLVYSIAFSPKGDSLVSADLQGRVIEWDVAAGKEKRRLDAAKLWKYDGGQMVDYGGVRDLSFSADGKFLACSGLIEASNPLGAVSNPAILLFDLTEGKEHKLQRPKDDAKGVGWGVRFHPAGFEILAAGGTGGGFLYVLRPDEVNEFAKFQLPNTARDLDLHPDGLTTATAHHDGILRLTALYAKPA